MKKIFTLLLATTLFVACNNNKVEEAKVAVATAPADLALTVIYKTDQDLNKLKSEIVNSVEKHSENLINISDEIWELAETAFNEHESSKILSDYAEKNGFSIEKGVAGMPTAFIATYGEGKPVIGVLGEFEVFLNKPNPLNLQFSKEVQVMAVATICLGVEVLGLQLL